MKFEIQSYLHAAVFPNFKCQILLESWGGTDAKRLHNGGDEGQNQGPSIN